MKESRQIDQDIRRQGIFSVFKSADRLLGYVDDLRQIFLPESLSFRSSLIHGSPMYLLGTPFSIVLILFYPIKMVPKYPNAMYRCTHIPVFEYTKSE